MKKYDVAIIGGGVVGTSIVRELARYKLKIALLEKEEELAFGVSKSNSGIVHAGTQNDPKSLKGKLCVQGNALMRKLSKELGFTFKEVGQLIVVFSENDIPRLEKLKTEGEELGVPGLKIVDRDWLRKNEPHLSPEVVSALYAPTAAIVSPYRVAYDMSENAKKNGVEIFTGCKVTSIEKGNDGFLISSDSGKFSAGYIVNAAGLFSDEVARMVGVDDFTIKPRKGEEYLLDKKLEHITEHIIFPLPSGKSKGILVIKTSDGNPMIGPTASEIDDKEDLSTSDAALEEVVAAAKKMVPSIESGTIIAYFAGLRPSAGDDFIIRSEEKVPGMITVAGIQSPGLTAAPAIALMVKDLLKKCGLKMRKKWIFHKHRKGVIHLFALSFSETERLLSKAPEYGDIVCRCEMVSAKEIEDAIDRGANTLDGIKFRTRAGAGRCHGGFCTTRIMRILSEKKGIKITEVTKRGKGSEIALEDHHAGRA